MRRGSILFFLLVSFTGIAHSAESADPGNANSPLAQDKKQYLVELSEYELEQAVPIGLSEREIIDRIHGSKAAPVATVRMTAVSSTRSMVKVEKRVTVTTGKMTQNNITTRSASQIDTGTMLSVTVMPHADGVVSDVEYCTVRLDGEGTDDSPPDLVTHTTESTQIYILGRERLFSVLPGEKVTCVLISVSEMQ